MADARSPGEGEIRAAVEWCGICGTDIEEWRSGPVWVPPPDRPHPLTGRHAPLVLGHEVSARVIDVGSGPSELAEGDLVAIDGLIGCGKCFWCRRNQVNLCPVMANIGLHFDGGLAEYVTVPAKATIRVPPGVGSDTAALAEPVSVAVRALRRGRMALGESVAVLGAGMIGLATAAVARAAGASQVIVVDPLPQRRSLAIDAGASAALDGQGDVAAETRALTDGLGVDLSVDAAGTATSGPQAIELSRSGGRTVIVGLAHQPSSTSFFTLVTGEKEVIGSLSHIADEDFAEAVRLLAAGVLTADMVGAVKVPLEAAVDRGFDALTHPGPPAKILVGGRRS
jgi:(R,R)-butanediol dehydrogenase / meso-butanediol dehydrogenase / diacetyl reductase